MLFLTSTVDKISNSIVQFLIESYDKKEEERKQKERGFYAGITIPKRTSTLRRDGYAFAQEDHSAPQLMDALSRNVRERMSEEKKRLLDDH